MITNLANTITSEVKLLKIKLSTVEKNVMEIKGLLSQQSSTSNSQIESLSFLSQDSSESSNDISMLIQELLQQGPYPDHQVPDHQVPEQVSAQPDVPAQPVVTPFEPMEELLRTQLQSWGMGHLEKEIFSDIRLAKTRDRLVLALIDRFFSKEEISTASYDKASLNPLDANRIERIFSIAFMRFGVGSEENIENIKKKIMVKIQGKCRGG